MKLKEFKTYRKDRGAICIYSNHIYFLQHFNLLHFWTFMNIHELSWLYIISVRFSSAAQSCPTLCNPVDCSVPGFPVLHHLLDFAQTHVCWVNDAIQTSHPLFPFLLTLQFIMGSVMRMRMCMTRMTWTIPSYPVIEGLLSVGLWSIHFVFPAWLHVHNFPPIICT